MSSLSHNFGLSGFLKYQIQKYEPLVFKEVKAAKSERAPGAENAHKFDLTAGLNAAYTRIIHAFVQQDRNYQ